MCDAEELVSMEIAKQFYLSMGMDLTKAAESLHMAVRKVRDIKPDEPSCWAPYIYTGC
jgi:hypothetical protein